jgi:hypothetical protein
MTKVISDISSLTWVSAFSAKVLMPVGRSRIDHKANRVYAVGMTKQQAEDLPKFDERSGVDQNHEEKSG